MQQFPWKEHFKAFRKYFYVWARREEQLYLWIKRSRVVKWITRVKGRNLNLFFNAEQGEAFICIGWSALIFATKTTRILFSFYLQVETYSVFISFYIILYSRLWSPTDKNLINCLIVYNYHSSAFLFPFLQVHSGLVCLFLHRVYTKTAANLSISISRN